MIEQEHDHSLKKMDISSYLKAPPANLLRVGVVGVTGAVGREMMLVMQKRGWQPKEIKVSTNHL
jgi:hypothetical protein